jgi:hypothetical protein
VAAYELVPGVRVTAAVQLLQFRSGAPDLVRARARVVSRDGTFTFSGGTIGWCAATALTVRAYAETRRSRAAAWISDLLPLDLPDYRRNPRDTVVACMPSDKTLLAGDTADLHATVNVRQILGDTLPAGRYRFTVVVHPNNKPGLSTPELAAGSLVLRR